MRDPQFNNKRIPDHVRNDHITMFETLIYYGSVALAVYKALAIIVTVLSILGIAYVAVKSAEMRHVRQISPSRKEEVENAQEQLVFQRALLELRDNTVKRWHQIVERLGSSPDKKDFKTAIIEADGLVDAALRAEGFSGETMADRLRAIPVGRLSDLDSLWKAHRVRNEIAHDPHYIVSPRAGHDMMKIYKKTLEELGAL